MRARDHAGATGGDSLAGEAPTAANALPLGEGKAGAQDGRRKETHARRAERCFHFRV